MESESYQSIPDQRQQVEVTADPSSPSNSHTLPEEGVNDTVQILFFTSNSNELESNPPIPSRQEENPPALVTQGFNSPIFSVHPPSSLVTSFDWNRLARYRLPSSVPF